jgi:hypothetical protein
MVSNLGRVKGPRGFSRPFQHENGYCVIGLSNLDGKILSIHLHRLVAWTFLGPPPNPKDIVHHKDSVRNNNVLSNLSWRTQQENTVFAKGKAVLQLDEAKNVVARFESCTLAAVAVNRHSSSIGNAIVKGQRSAGHFWVRETQTEKCANGA